MPVRRMPFSTMLWPRSLPQFGGGGGASCLVIVGFVFCFAFGAGSSRRLSREARRPSSRAWCGRISAARSRLPAVQSRHHALIDRLAASRRSSRTRCCCGHGTSHRCGCEGESTDRPPAAGPCRPRGLRHRTDRRQRREGSHAERGDRMFATHRLNSRLEGRTFRGQCIGQKFDPILPPEHFAVEPAGRRRADTNVMPAGSGSATLTSLAVDGPVVRHDHRVGDVRCRAASWSASTDLTIATSAIEVDRHRVVVACCWTCWSRRRRR